jgi:hypothetical protein
MSSRLLIPVVGGLMAAAAAGAGMGLLRWTMQVRTIPERVMEWALLFVPPAFFEAALLRFGFDAKRYALYGAIAVMLSLLAALGALVLRRHWSDGAILALGLGLWLFTMAVIMPLTSAGFFAFSLINGKEAAIGGYLAVGLAYATALVVVRALLERPPLPGAARHAYTRRSALILAGGVVGVFATTFLVDRWLPKTRTGARVIVMDPQEPVPSGGIEPPNPHPNRVVTEVPVVPATSPPAPADPGPAPTSAPTLPTVPTAVAGPDDIPEPPVARQLTRDKDGAVLPSGRRPGELA